MSGSDSPTFFHGQPWSSWIERIGRDKPLSDEEPEAEPVSSVMRLSVDAMNMPTREELVNAVKFGINSHVVKTSQISAILDIDLYGFCPERDTFYGVVCEICNSIVKPQALIQHMESRHSSGTVNLPPPSTPASKAPVKTPYCKMSKLKKSQSTPQLPVNSSKINHTTIKRTTEPQPNLHSTVSVSPRSPLESLSVQSTFTGTVVSSPVKSPGTNNQPKRKRLKTDRSLLKDREYDPDRHCGVWNDETGKPCTRSLTCKAHTVSLRRTVAGRSKTFDKLLADHRASKELPASRPAKITVSGTVTVASDSSNLNSLAPGTPVSSSEPDVPSSPPVLSLPDTYPLPQAVDLLYRCLAPHGSTKPTKLEEEFVTEELRVEPQLRSSTDANTMMAPISVVLPSLSPIPAHVSPTPSLLQYSRNISSSPIGIDLMAAKRSPAAPVVPAPLPVVNQPVTTVTLEGKTPVDIDSEIKLYSPIAVYKEKNQVTAQISRPNNLVQSPVSRSYQSQASMTNVIFETVDHVDTHSNQITNGKRVTNHANHQSPVPRPAVRVKNEFPQEFSTTSIQVEATTTSTPYSHFGDISWSSCHPEPLAVSRWLRITSSRKQYNFNIH